ncbi:MAG: hypothetical protein ACUVTO_04730 [Candidatus Caldatribacteriaceae bacterium]
MGTFLRVVGIIVMCVGVVFAVFAVFGVRGWMHFLGQSSLVPEETPSFGPLSGFVWAGGLGGILGGFGMVVGGAALFCLGTIYNEVKSLRG